jgi:hypothetical protein
LALAQGATDFEARDAGQHDVEDDRVVIGGIRPIERLFAGLGKIDCMAFVAETALDQIGQSNFVFNDEDAHETCLRLPGALIPAPQLSPESMVKVSDETYVN